MTPDTSCPTWCTPVWTAANWWISWSGFTALTGLLAPVVTRELARTEDDDADRELPACDGPLFLLGGRVLVDATWAMVGLEPLEPVLALLERRLDDALTGLGTGLTGAVVAEALIRAFAGSYRCEMPGDAECLKRLGPTQSGNPLHDLILARAVAPENSLRLGLIVLGVLADLAAPRGALLYSRLSRGEFGGYSWV